MVGGSSAPGSCALAHLASLATSYPLTWIIRPRPPPLFVARSRLCPPPPSLSFSYVYTFFGTSGQLTLGPVALVSLFMSETFTSLGIPLTEKDKVGGGGAEG